MRIDHSDVASRLDRNHQTAAAELVSVLESETETLTSAVTAGRLTVADLDRFLRVADRVDVRAGVASEVRIVRSLLSDTQPVWAEMEPSS